MNRSTLQIYEKEPLQSWKINMKANSIHYQLAPLPVNLGLGGRPATSFGGKTGLGWSIGGFGFESAWGIGRGFTILGGMPVSNGRLPGRAERDYVKEEISTVR